MLNIELQTSLTNMNKIYIENICTLIIRKLFLLAISDVFYKSVLSILLLFI